MLAFVGLDWLVASSWCWRCVTRYSAGTCTGSCREALPLPTTVKRAVVSAQKVIYTSTLDIVCQTTGTAGPPLRHLANVRPSLAPRSVRLSVWYTVCRCLIVAATDRKWLRRRSLIGRLIGWSVCHKPVSTGWPRSWPDVVEFDVIRWTVDWLNNGPRVIGDQRVSQAGWLNSNNCSESCNSRGETGIFLLMCICAIIMMLHVRGWACIHLGWSMINFKSIDVIRSAKRLKSSSSVTFMYNTEFISSSTNYF
jgi:hypothetical protein